MNNQFRTILNWAGRNGPLLLFAGVLVGLIAPPLAEAARPLLGLAVFVFVFVFTLGAFLKVNLASFRLELQQRCWVALALLWTTFGVPLVMIVLVFGAPARGAELPDAGVCCECRFPDARSGAVRIFRPDARPHYRPGERQPQCHAGLGCRQKQPGGNQQVELYLAMSVFPIFVLPLLERWPIEQILRVNQVPLTASRPQT